MWEAFKRELVEHILTMADNPAFVEHARYRVRELREQDPALFGDLPEMLTEAMKGRKEPCCTTPTSSSGTAGASGVPASNAVHGQKPC